MGSVEMERFLFPVVQAVLMTLAAGDVQQCVIVLNVVVVVVVVVVCNNIIGNVVIGLNELFVLTPRIFPLRLSPGAAAGAAPGVRRRVDGAGQLGRGRTGVVVVVEGAGVDAAEAAADGGKNQQRQQGILKGMMWH